MIIFLALSVRVNLSYFKTVFYRVCVLGLVNIFFHHFLTAVSIYYKRLRDYLPHPLRLRCCVVRPPPLLGGRGIPGAAAGGGGGGGGHGGGAAFKLSLQLLDRAVLLFVLE